MLLLTPLRNSKVSGERILHLVAFDIPVPVNYGGAIDVYYKIRALHEAGIRIILHCFQYGRPHAPELEEYCEKVYYYHRNISKIYLFYKRPYIVVTRHSKRLLMRLSADDHPILFEGLHSCYYLAHPALRDKRKVVRTHNVEHDYYSGLADVERNMLYRAYFRNEARKLRRFEERLKYASGIAAISRNDHAHFSARYRTSRLISAFHAHEKVTSKPGRGSYALYHGSLEVGENNEAALFLVNEVFNGLNIPLVIAGNKPTDELIRAVENCPNITIERNLTTEQIHSLVADAHVNVLPTFQTTGIKLKLLAALYLGRFCLVNTPMVDQSGLEPLCTIKDTVKDMRAELNRLFAMEFSQDMLEMRANLLEKNGFLNSENVHALISMLYQEEG